MLISIPLKSLKGPPGALWSFSPHSSPPHPGQGIFRRVMGLEYLFCGCHRDDKKARGGLQTGVLFCRHKQGARDRFEINPPTLLPPAISASFRRTCREPGKTAGFPAHTVQEFKPISPGSVRSLNQFHLNL